MAKRKTKNNRSNKTKTNKASSKSQNTTAELLESPEALQEKLQSSEAFFKKNKTILIIVGAVLILSIGAVFGYLYMKNQQEKEAQVDIFPAIYYFEADSLDKALYGDGNYEGFIAITENYPLSKTGNLANFYAGAALLKKGEYEQAIQYLKEFNRDDLLVRGRAKALIGDAYMELNKLNDAISYYEEAANYQPNKFFTPQYLMKLALAYELNKNKEEALKVYDKIINEYYNSAERPNAMKYKAKLTAQP